VRHLALHLAKYVGELADGLERIEHPEEHVKARQGYARLAVWRRDRIKDARQTLDLLEEAFNDLRAADREYAATEDELLDR
jgi:hypothetical protein